VPQDHAQASHAPMLTKADGAIDFTRPAAIVAARIRGVDPWPGAQTVLRGQVIKLFRACADGEGAGAPPGTVLAVDTGGLRVACGDGVVVIRELQAPGRKRLTAAQFAAGRGVAVGDVLAKPELP
jgi:methionyl-tRNA formyltransferase